MRGNNHYWLGKTFSEEHKKKISLAGIGRICSVETKQKLKETPNEGQFTKGHDRTPRIKLPIAEIVDLCKKQNKCVKEIANIFNVGCSTITRRLIRNGVEIRTLKEARKIAIANGRQKTLFNGHGPRWKGGRAKSGQYIKLYMPDYPYANSKGYILEHRYVMECKLGRKLRVNEIVHHINGIKTDNRENNLIIAVRENHFGHVDCPKCNYHFLIK